MKICQCGAIVSGTSRSGQTCPKCGRTWIEIERSRSDKNKIVRAIVAVIVILFLPVLGIISNNKVTKEKKRIEKEEQKKELDLKNFYATQIDVGRMWKSANVDSVVVAAHIILKFDSLEMNRIVDKADNELSKLIESAVDTKQKLEFIAFAAKVDSINRKLLPDYLWFKNLSISRTRFMVLLIYSPGGYYDDKTLKKNEKWLESIYKNSFEQSDK
jgi:hypothetical protein